jgi:hypothetical protein
MTEALLTPTQAEALDNHGYDQAKAQARSIARYVEALNCDYDRLEDLRDEREELASAAQDPESEDEMAFAASNLANWDADNAEELKQLQDQAGDCENQEQARERIQEDALSVEVRSAWASLGSTLEADEFRIVLCTGGPHVEIRGEIGTYGEPSRAWLQYQDWGTPLTQFFDIEQSTLIEYCRQFYFGE